MAHGLSPQRVESPAGSEQVAFKFTASNNFKVAQLYEVQCYKGDFKHVAECEALPGEFWVAPGRKRPVKVQIRTSGDGVYLVCTKQIPAEEDGQNVVTRVCARWGVGVSPASSNDKALAGKKKPTTKTQGY